MTSTSLSSSLSAPTINRPNVVAVGTIVWLGSEVMFFAGLFAMYFTLRSTSPELWEAGTEKFNIPFAATITTILVLSSVTAQFGVFAAERLQPRRTGWKPTQWGMIEWFFLTYAMGAVFVAGQVYEYSVLTTGFHGLHVTGGLIAFLLVIGRAYAVKTFTHRDATSAIVVSYYWHFVDVVWIGLFLVIYILQ